MENPEEAERFTITNKVVTRAMEIQRDIIVDIPSKQLVFGTREEKESEEEHAKCGQRFQRKRGGRRRAERQRGGEVRNWKTKYVVI